MNAVRELWEDFTHAVIVVAWALLFLFVSIVIGLTLDGVLVW